MITLMFQHKHECRHKGQIVTVRPPVDAGAYTVPVLRCIQTDQDLHLVSKET